MASPERPDRLRYQRPPAEPLPQQPQTSAAVLVLLVVTVILLVANLGLTIYVFGVAHDIVELGQELKRYFGG